MKLSDYNNTEGGNSPTTKQTRTIVQGQFPSFSALIRMARMILTMTTYITVPALKGETEKFSSAITPKHPSLTG